MTVATKYISALLLLVCALPMFAADAHRRATAANVALVVIHGKVTDSATGTPVRFADIANTPRTTQTDVNGNYEIEVPLGLPTSLQISRSGYDSVSTSVTGKNALEANFTMKGKPTVTMKLTDGTTYNLDTDTAQFAEEIPFSSAARSDAVAVCNTEGIQGSLNKADIAKILGPGVTVTDATCCKQTTVLKVTFALRNGSTQDDVLSQTCTGSEMDFAGRDHVTGIFVYKKFKDIAEIDFP